MSKHAHTPGPWALETVKTSCGICHKIGPFPKTNDEETHACVYVDNRAWQHQDELKANARLIAAAPALLVALEGTLTKWVDLANSGDAGFWNPEEEEHVIAARAAIAAAKGEGE